MAAGIITTIVLPTGVGLSLSTPTVDTATLPAAPQKSSSPELPPKSETIVSSSTSSTSLETTGPSVNAATGSGRNPSSSPVPTLNGSSNRNGTIPTSQRRDSNSISPGAAAGIGIGCAVAGALIAAIIALLFYRRRRRRTARSDVIPLNGFGSVGKSVASPDLPSPAGGVVEQNLPQPAEDQALGGEMSRLRTSIKNHVQSYYHTNAVRGNVDPAALSLVAAGNMPLIASTLGSLLSNPATRLTAIRFCIAWVVISRIEHSCDPSMSFLPPEIANCLISIAGAREDPSTRMAFMSKWRAITASLLQSKYGGNSFSSYDPRNPNIAEALRSLDAILAPFATEERDSRERTQKLEEILRRGARFGFLLFSQPSTWEFDWNTPPNAGRGALAVSPALLQVGDDNGRRLPRPRTLEEQELARGLESFL
ncbi:MAG: hypothetical protein Q9207_005246 [Kuettlingeria erythrocarpa]